MGCGVMALFLDATCDDPDARPDPTLAGLGKSLSLALLLSILSRAASAGKVVCRLACERPSVR